MNHQIKVFAESRDYRRKISLYLAEFDQSGKLVGEADPLTFSQCEHDYATKEEPLISISNVAAQELLDQLWNMGFRPNNEDTIGAAKAKDAHLQSQQQNLEYMRLALSKFIDQATGRKL